MQLIFEGVVESYLETTLLVLEAPVQVQGAGADLSILKLAAVGTESGATAVDVLAGVGKLGGTAGDDRGEDGEETEAGEELHGDFVGIVEGNRRL